MDYVRIELQGGSILTYKYSQIKKFTKEKQFTKNQTTTKENAQSNSPTIIVQQQQQQQQQEEQQTVPSPIVQPQKVGYTNSQKMMMYEDQKKSPTTAGVLSFLISSTGHAYAGNWGRGLLFLGGRIACIAIISAGASKTTDSQEYNYYTDQWETTTINSSDKDLITAGTIGLIGLAIWEIFDAVSETRKYNRRLYNRIYNNVPNFGFNLTPIKNGAQLSLTYNF